MGRVYINIPERIHIRDYGDILKSTSSSLSGTEVVLCFKDVTFITPEMLMLLVTLSKLVYEKVHQPMVWSDLRSDTYSYLERLDIGTLEFVTLRKPPHTSLL